jgi:hypothetical protein
MKIEPVCPRLAAFRESIGHPASGCGDPLRGSGVRSEVVVAAAQILDEGVAMITTCAIRSVCNPRIGLSRRLSSPVIGFYRIVGVLLDVVPRGRISSSSTPRLRCVRRSEDQGKLDR